ncbi:MAG: GDSL-type esterase/lipase family protein [Mucinivorans sp.]
MRQTFYIFILVAIVLVSCASAAVEPPTKTVPSVFEQDSLLIHSYSFVKPEADTIIDSTHSLDSFYASLAQLSKAKAGEEPRVVSVVHYGDSHIQGGILGETLMRHYALVYGTAGRGFISPHKLAGQNEPRDYSITSSVRHTALMVNERGDELSRGVSGVSIAAPAGIDYTLKVMDLPEDSIDYRFSRVVVFHDSLAPVVSVRDTSILGECGADDTFRSYTTTIELLDPTDSLLLVTHSDPPFSGGPIYGFSLENNRSGVIYHAMGVNGACYTHWGRYADIARQSEALAPQLIVISLGSNEASGSNFVESAFLSEVDSFVSALRRANPTSAVLLVSPPEAMRRVRGSRTRRPNKNFEAVSLALARYAAEHGIAFFDLYRATGGANSSVSWAVAGMMGRDRIHYTAEGYRLQGALIFTAIERGMKLWKR